MRRSASDTTARTELPEDTRANVVTSPPSPGSRGLVACWRESLLAQAVLAGRTRGYRHHPQLERFRAADSSASSMSSESSASSASSAPSADPVAVVGCYLWGLHHEAVRRGYRFDSSKIDAPEDGCAGLRLPVTEGQMRRSGATSRPSWLGALRICCPARAPRAASPLPRRSRDVESWEHAVI